MKKFEPSPWNQQGPFTVGEWARKRCDGDGGEGGKRRWWWWWW